jgi:hypothetical protein
MTAHPGIYRTTTRHLRVERRDICFLKFIFEAYEGIAVLETINGPTGHVALHTAPGCEDMVAGILMDLARQCRMEDINETQRQE